MWLLFVGCLYKGRSSDSVSDFYIVQLDLLCNIAFHMLLLLLSENVSLFALNIYGMYCVYFLLLLNIVSACFMFSLSYFLYRFLDFPIWALFLLIRLQSQATFFAQLWFCNFDAILHECVLMDN